MSDNPTNPFVNEWIIAANQSPYRASPSMFGVLPATDSTTAGFQHFSFTGMNPNILNSTLSKGDGQPQYFITTHTTTPGYTILTNVQGRNEVLIEWSHGCAMVEIAGALQKQYASMFLQLSPDRRFRIMNFAGDRYAWMARDKNILMVICRCTTEEGKGVWHKSARKRGSSGSKFPQLPFREGFWHRWYCRQYFSRAAVSLIESLEGVLAGSSLRDTSC